MGQEHTVKMSMYAVIMHCDKITFKKIQEHFGISIGSSLVRKGIRYLVRNYKLQFERDNNSLGYLLTKEDKDTLRELASNEVAAINSNKQENKSIDEKVVKDDLILLIEDFHKERIAFKEKFNLLNDKLLKIERYILSKV